MDGSRFDDLTRALATGVSRRRVLTTLAGGLAVAAGALRGGGAEAATCRGAGRLCTQDAHCCSGLCDPASTRCACPAGTVDCRGACVDRASSPQHCGGCDVACGGGATCQAGACVPATLISELTPADPIFTRCGWSGNVYPYDVYLYHHGGGPLRLGVRGAASGGGTLNDPTVAFHTSFDPAAGCAGLVAQADDGGCGFDAFLAIADLAAGDYTIVVSTYARNLEPAAFGTYTVEFGGDGLCPP